MKATLEDIRVVLGYETMEEFLREWETLSPDEHEELWLQAAAEVPF